MVFEIFSKSTQHLAKMKKILLIIFMLYNFTCINAQNLNLETNTGIISTYALADIQKITFSSLEVITQLSNGNTETAPFTDVKHLYFSDIVVTSISDKSKPINLTLAINPNPVNDYLNISFFTEHVGNTLIEIYDLQGNIIKSDNQNIVLAGKQSIRLSMNNANGSKITTGFYFLKFTNNGNSVVKPLVIAN